MRRSVRAGLLVLGAGLLLFRLGRPALWQDEAETALRAVSVQRTGLPRTSVDGALVTTQPSLAKYEGRPDGVWIWNTWLSVYLTAASFSVLGPTPFAARLPFALAALASLWLFLLLFEEESPRPWAAEAGLAMLVLSPAFLLFARQSRYYALTSLGSVLVLLSWRRLLAGRKGGAAAVAFALLFLLHSWFAFFAVAVLALAADAALRGRECLAPRFLGAAAATAALSLPAFWYFRVWERPGNHLYAAAEALEFLKTFLLWISLFSLPALLPAAAAAKRGRWALVAAGFLLLCGLASEGSASRAAAALSFAWLCANAARAKGMERLARLWLAAALGLLSLTAAEPYGRYLMGALPALAYLSGRWISELADGRAARALGLAAFLAVVNWAGWLPLKAAAFLSAPAAPAESVSGMMRRRLLDVGPRSDLARFAGELARGPEGYIEPAAAAIRAGGGGTAFSDADNLSLLFAAGAKPVSREDKPDWLLLSPWLALDPAAAVELSSLARSGAYAPAGVEAPRLLWQNNPDPLFRDFSPKTGPLALFRRRAAGR